MSKKLKASYKHTLPPQDLDLKKALHEERHLLQEAQVPIVTVSATYRKELADKYFSLVHTASDVVYSRAHYSMGEAVVEEARRERKKVHISDPTNFVSEKDWGKIEFTQKVGQLMARHKMLKTIKDKIDTIARGKLPITQAITLPLLYLTGKTVMPIISLHYEAGNILVENDRQVLQVITDPHVRPQYLDPLPSDNIFYCVFDEETKNDFFAMAKKLEKRVSPNQVIVTGPPVDPRIVDLYKIKKQISVDKPIHLGVTTGGLGTNFGEIKTFLTQIAPLLKPPEKIRLFLNAGTHRDFRNWFEDFASDNNVRIGDLDDKEARIRILYDDSIIDANNNLIKHMFPWAHGIVTKPSGDMAYDAAAAGCFLLFLEPWGDWEKNIQKRLVAEKIGLDLDVENALNNLTSWLEDDTLKLALKYVHSLSPLYLRGAENILKAHGDLFDMKKERNG